MKLLIAAVASAVGLLMSGCTAEQPPSPSPIASDPVDKSNFIKLDRAVGERLFRLEELPFPANALKPPIVAVGIRLQQACKTKLPTDDRIVTESSAMWQSVDKEVLVDQTVIAYDRPVGRQAREEARAALTCETYKQLDRVFDQIELVDVANESWLSFCERVRPDQRGDTKQVWLCTLIVGEDDLACSVRAWTDERALALTTIQTLGPLILKKCRHDQ